MCHKLGEINVRRYVVICIRRKCEMKFYRICLKLSNFLHAVQTFRNLLFKLICTLYTEINHIYSPYKLFFLTTTNTVAIKHHTYNTLSPLRRHADTSCTRPHVSCILLSPSLDNAD